MGVMANIGNHHAGVGSRLTSRARWSAILEFQANKETTIQRRQEKGDMGCPVKYPLYKYDHVEKQGVVRMPVTTAPRMWP